MITIATKGMSTNRYVWTKFHCNLKGWEEATRWERLHEDALKGKFMHRQKRSEVPWPEIPTDFDEWSPPRKKWVWIFYNYVEGNKVSEIFCNYVHNVVMDITDECFVVINYRIIGGCVCDCF